MISADFEFAWPVPRAGFEWVESEWHLDGEKVSESRLLLEAGGGSCGRRSYAPLKDFPALFHNFSDVPPTEEGVRDFANRFGELGVAALYVPGEGPQEHHVLGVMGETLTQWREEIDWMSSTVKILDLVLERNVVGLSELIHWRAKPDEQLGPQGWVCGRDDRGYIIAREEGVGPFTPRDIISPAFSLVMKRVNDKLRDHITFQLIYDESLGRPVPAMKPATLLDAMWLQLGVALGRTDTFRRCRTCRQWFSVSADKRKAGQVFCSNPCKSKDFRRRRQALELDARGKSAKAIAREMQVDVTVVTEWLSREKE